VRSKTRSRLARIDRCWDVSDRDDLLATRDHALANEKTLIDQQNQKLKQLKADRKRLEDEGSST